VPKLGPLGSVRGAVSDDGPYRDQFCRLISLLPVLNSLFREIFSLLICVGNFSKSRCGTSISCSRVTSRGPKTAIFPVKFPVSREFARRRVRSALRRQPGSNSTEDCLHLKRRNARQ
jgi:hypothetical protein